MITAFFSRWALVLYMTCKEHEQMVQTHKCLNTYPCNGCECLYVINERGAKQHMLLGICAFLPCTASSSRTTPFACLTSQRAIAGCMLQT